MIVAGNFDLCLLQETKSRDLTKRMISSIWSNCDFDWMSKNASGRSRGLLSVWRTGLFDVQFSFSGENFIGLCIEHHGRIYYIVNVHSSCNMAGKRRPWDELRGLRKG